MATINSDPGGYVELETKLFNGIVYSVALVKDSCSVHILIGEGTDAISEDITFVDVPAENHQELLNRGHSRAQQLIQSSDPHIEAMYKKIDKSGIDDA